MAPPSTRFLILPAALALIGCFNSDELAGNDETSSGGGTDTVTMYSDESAGESDDGWTAEDTGPGETTCRDAIDCLVTCQFQQLLNEDPEPNLSCFLECDMGLTKDEAYLLIKLAECIGKRCADLGECGPESTNTKCLTCIAAHGQDEQPPGCLDEAAACK